MGIYLKLACRNTLRNRRRTAITLAAMAAGASAIILFGGFVHFIFWGVREGAIHSELGHIQVYRRGFTERGGVAPFDYLITDAPGIRALVESVEHVRIVTPRLGLSGLISTGNTTTSFFGLGVDPAKEADLGTFLTVIDGLELSERQPQGAIIGKGLAAGIGARTGDSLTLLTTTRHGSINAVEVLVRGIFESSAKEFDDRAIKVPLATVDSLLDAGGAVQSLVVVLDETEHTAAVRDRLQALFAERGLDLELRTWDQLALRYHQVRTLFGNIFRVVTAIVAVVAVFGVANTMTMAVFERTREVGTIMAIGTKRRGVVALFLSEGLILGVAGGLLGLGVGVLLAKLLSIHGIPMAPPPGSTRGFTARFWVVPDVLALAFGISVVTAVLSSLYPALRASRLHVVDALRHV
jgi:putative ABC transport system permease protein